MTASGGGGSAGNIVDGVRNDDWGGSGGGSSGQKVYNCPIPVTPGETVYIYVGGGGGRAYGGRDSGNQGGNGGTTYIYTRQANYYLLGGVGGYGGVGDNGRLFPGGTQTTANSSLLVSVSQGDEAYYKRGGAGGLGVAGLIRYGGSYGGGNSFHPELDALDYGGGGAGAFSTYVREDNGNSPCWGGLGKGGIVTFVW